MHDIYIYDVTNKYKKNFDVSNRQEAKRELIKANMIILRRPGIKFMALPC